MLEVEEDADAFFEDNYWVDKKWDDYTYLLQIWVLKYYTPILFLII